MSAENEVVQSESEDDVVLRAKWLIFNNVASYLDSNIPALSAIEERGANKSESEKRKHVAFAKKIHLRWVEDKIDEMYELLKSFGLSENQCDEVFSSFSLILIEMFGLIGIGPSSDAMKLVHEVVSESAESFESKMSENPEIMSQEEIDAILSATDEEE